MRKLLLPLLVVPVATGAWSLLDQTPQTPPYTQNWGNTALIATTDEWSGVPGVIGCRGDGLTEATGTDPQTIVAADNCAVVDVNANQTTPNTSTSGGVSEFEITDPVVALQGSGTADAPYLLFTIKTTNLRAITVAYTLRDIDGSSDNAIQQVALQYRVGTTGDFTNLPGGYVADASTGPNLEAQTTPVSVILPAAAENQPVVQFRVITTNALGNDEWIGVDNVSVVGTVRTAVEADFVARNARFTLVGAQPAPQVRLQLRSDVSGPVQVRAYDALGRQVATLFEGSLAAGDLRDVTLSGMPAGVYVVRAIGPNLSASRTVVLR